jgi:hypothetical protein
MPHLHSYRSSIVAFVVNVAARTVLAVIIIVLLLVWLVFAVSSIVVRGLFRVFPV